MFDNTPYISPSLYYPFSLAVYTYGKTLLAPGERLGYLALSPLMPETTKVEMRKALKNVQLMGYSFPNSSTMRAVADLEKLSIDIKMLERRRDRLYSTLTAQGYSLAKPQGTFYMMMKVPSQYNGDDNKFVTDLAGVGVLCLPGSLMDLPGYVRLCLTANDKMVELSIPLFKRFSPARAKL